MIETNREAAALERTSLALERIAAALERLLRGPQQEKPPCPAPVAPHWNGDGTIYALTEHQK
jgi:hypothetical protein